MLHTPWALCIILCGLLLSCEDPKRSGFEDQINLFSFADGKPDLEQDQFKKLSEKLQTSRFVLVAPGAPIRFTGFEAPR